MIQPEGFKSDKRLVCLLTKSLCGLNQTGRARSKKIHDVLTELGFTRMEADYCVYQFINKSTVICLCVYVDGLLLFSNNAVAFKRRLSREQNLGFGAKLLLLTSQLTLAPFLLVFANRTANMYQLRWHVVLSCQRLIVQQKVQLSKL
jgi:hypothetical protein